MSLTLADKKIAILIANGFDENQMTEIQRALTKARANLVTIAPEQGVVNGWQGEGWGHYFPVNAPIGEALGSDFDILVVPGGERGITKLKTNPHARRIVTHFIEAEKPIAVIGAGGSLLTFTGKMAGRTLAAPAALHDEMTAAGVIVSEASQHLDGAILSANGDDINAWVQEALTFFNGADAIMQAA